MQDERVKLLKWVELVHVVELKRRLDDCSGAGTFAVLFDCSSESGMRDSQETKTKDNDKGYLGPYVHFQFPHHRHRYDCEENVGHDVDRCNFVS